MLDLKSFHHLWYMLHCPCYRQIINLHSLFRHIIIHKSNGLQLKLLAVIFQLTYNHGSRRTCSDNQCSLLLPCSGDEAITENTPHKPGTADENNMQHPRDRKSVV